MFLATVLKLVLRVDLALNASLSRISSIVSLLWISILHASRMRHWIIWS